MQTRSLLLIFGLLLASCGSSDSAEIITAPTQVAEPSAQPTATAIPTIAIAISPTFLPQPTKLSAPTVERVTVEPTAKPTASQEETTDIPVIELENDVVPQPAPPSADGLMLQANSPSNSLFIVRNGTQTPLAPYESIQLRGTDGFGFAMKDGQLYNLRSGQLHVRDLSLDNQRLNSDYFYRALWGVVGDWIMTSSTPKDETVGQTFGSITAVSRDGAMVQFLSEARAFHGPGVAPDGSRIIYHDGEAVYAWYADGTQETLPLPLFRSATVSPDSNYVALDILPKQFHLYDLRTNELVAQASQFDRLGGDGFNRPIWSLNSTQIAFDSAELLDEPPNMRPQTRLLHINGSEHNIPDAIRVAFSPDGEWLAMEQFLNQAESDDRAIVLHHISTGKTVETMFTGYPIGWVTIKTTESP